MPDHHNCRASLDNALWFVRHGRYGAAVACLVNAYAFAQPGEEKARIGAVLLDLVPLADREEG